MTSNSAIFSSQVFGNSSGATAEELSANNTKTMETFFAQSTITKINNRHPMVPSNQHIARDK